MSCGPSSMTLSQCVLCCLSLIQWVPCELRSSQWAEPRLVGPVSPEPKSSSLSPHAKKTKPPEGFCLLNYCQIPAKSLKGSCCCCQFSDKPPMVFHHLHRWTPEILFQCSCWLLEGPLRCCYNHHRDPTCFVITGLLLDQMSSTSAAGIPPCLVTLSSRGLPSSSLLASSKASRGVPSPLPLPTKAPESLHLHCCWHPAWHAEELCFLNCRLVPARPPERSRHVFCCWGTKENWCTTSPYILPV